MIVKYNVPEITDDILRRLLNRIEVSPQIRTQDSMKFIEAYLQDHYSLTALQGKYCTVKYGQRGTVILHVDGRKDYNVLNTIHKMLLSRQEELEHEEQHAAYMIAAERLNKL